MVMIFMMKVIPKKKLPFPRPSNLSSAQAEHHDNEEQERQDDEDGHDDDDEEKKSRHSHDSQTAQAEHHGDEEESYQLNNMKFAVEILKHILTHGNKCLKNRKHELTT